MMDLTTHLRAGTRGSSTHEAATELMIRAFNGQLIATTRPWMRCDPYRSWYIAYSTIPHHVTGLPREQARVLAVAASLAAGAPISLGETLPGLERELVGLILAAIAHAADTQADDDIYFNHNNELTFGKMPPLHPWPRVPGYTEAAGP